MKYNYLFTLFLLFAGNLFSQSARMISYKGILYGPHGTVIKNAHQSIYVSILNNSLESKAVYKESHQVDTDTAGQYMIRIGNGGNTLGAFDSIIWSDGVYFLRIESAAPEKADAIATRNILLRIPATLSNDHEEGTVSAFANPGWGISKITNTRRRRPKLVTIDLTTSYVNLAYPADSYPIYRHYEWCDPDMDGIGNSFTISYSENTSNNFQENTTKLGEVKLYLIPFQDIDIYSSAAEIEISLSEPAAVSNKGTTYAIKGPWKFIYYIEW